MRFAFLSMAVLISTAGCSKDKAGSHGATPKTFKCRKSGFDGGPWRECAPNVTRCEEYGCFEREEAYCFPVLFNKMDGSTLRFMICTPTERECEEWNEDRKRVPNKALGPCVLSRADEYVEFPEE